MKQSGRTGGQELRMDGSYLTLQAMAYVPGAASGLLRRDTSHPGSIALVGQAEALNPITQPAAFIIVDGAPLCHPLIGLVAQHIPTVIIESSQAELLESDTEVTVDGATGLITTGETGIPPTPVPSIPKAGKPVRLTDGTEVCLTASVRNAAQAHQALMNGAGAIGLVRSEFLAWDAAQPPDTSRLTDEFESLFSSAGGLIVTMRLIDIASDKPPRWLPDAHRLLRPFGMQGSRLFRREPVKSVVRHQLAALAALSDRYAFEVLIPYVSSRRELERWVDFVRQYIPGSVPVGTMAETPSAVLDLANWNDLVNFFAIGANDLMQGLFGADRDEPTLRDILDPYAPVLYRLLRQVFEPVDDYQDRVRVCGVLPRLTGTLPVLVGLGYRRFSVDPVWIPYMAKELRTVSLADAQELAGLVCSCGSSLEVRRLLGLSG